MAFILTRPGVRVFSIYGEQDDNDGIERKTGPCAWGHITAHNHTDAVGVNSWNVTFKNGTSVILTDIELADLAQYRLSDPASARELLLSLKWRREQQEALLDEGSLTETADLLDHTDELLKMLDAVDDAKRAHVDADLSVKSIDG